MNQSVISMEQLLVVAIDIAKKYHQGQVDKGGNPYIDHPMAVMDRLETIEEKIVGVLHDIVEDTVLTLEDLLELGFPEFIVEAIDSVTRRDDETRGEFIKRAKQNAIGRKVKIADILDNMNLDRIPNKTIEDEKRVIKYVKELRKLLKDDDELINH
ncbi:GTP pyrophosphokinase [[Brevibacterium] frigoritolerans]|nr:GTP pyrophosphokinase [Peribacillus frigoritolerans]